MGRTANGRLDSFERFSKERTLGSWLPMTNGADPIESREEVEALAKADLERWNRMFPELARGGFSIVSVPGSKGHTIVWHDGTFTEEDGKKYVRLYMRHCGLTP